MENTRFLLYLVVVGLILLLLGTIKSFLPHPEPQRYVDYAGLNLFKPVLYGSVRHDFDNNDEEVIEKKSSVPTNPNEKPTPKAEASQSDKPEEPEKKVTPSDKIEKSVNHSEYFNQMILDYKNAILTGKKYRNDVVVRYYKHLPDEDRVEVLVDYGFYLHKREVRDTLRYKAIMSNVIYYGGDFPVNDLKLITYLLVNNGLQIKEIRRFKDFYGWKRNAIEIGGDPNLDAEVVISFDEIRNLK